MSESHQAPIDRSGCSATVHGDQWAYSSYQCRCPDAREASRLYRKRLREGRQPRAFVDSTGTKRRVRALQAIGWPAKELSRRVGHRKPSGQAFSTLLTRTRCHRNVAARVAALYEQLRHIPGPSRSTAMRAQRAGFPPPTAWDGRAIDDPAARPRRVDAMQQLLVDATGSRRRVQALQAIGWPKQELAGRLGWQSTRWFEMLLASERMYREQAEAIRRLYDELSMTPGPSARARAKARAAGYAAPLAWDDDEIDDPAATPHIDVADVGDEDQADDKPDPVAVQLACSGELPGTKLRPVDQVAAVSALAARELKPGTIARRLRISDWAVRRVLKANGAEEQGNDREEDGDAA